MRKKAKNYSQDRLDTFLESIQNFNEATDGILKKVREWMSDEAQRFNRNEKLAAAAIKKFNINDEETINAVYEIATSFIDD